MKQPPAVRGDERRPRPAARRRASARGAADGRPRPPSDWASPARRRTGCCRPSSTATSPCRPSDRVYHAGPVLELSGHSHVGCRAGCGPRPWSRCGSSSTPSARPCNLSVRIGTTVRFIASVECDQALRVGSREGMVFPAHAVTGGLVMLAALSSERVDALYAPERFADRPGPPAGSQAAARGPARGTPHRGRTEPGEVRAWAGRGRACRAGPGRRCSGRRLGQHADGPLPQGTRPGARRSARCGRRGDHPWSGRDVKGSTSREGCWASR